MITYKDKEQIDIMKHGGALLHHLLLELGKMVAPGVCAMELEEFARKEIQTQGAIPAFLNYDTGFMGRFPAALCISVNEEVVHGIPTPSKIFKEGDLIGIDCGIWYQGLCVDAAITTSCGTISQKAQKLLDATEKALELGIAACRTGNFIADISRAIQSHVESRGFHVIKSLVGHGVGFEVHEDPQIPNFFPFDPRHPENKGVLLKEGLTLAIEPMTALSTEKTRKGKDGYAAETADRSLSAHFEHTVAITTQGALILTA